jgi:hypothetical protein
LPSLFGSAGGDRPEGRSSEDSSLSPCFWANSFGFMSALRRPVGAHGLQKPVQWRCDLAQVVHELAMRASTPQLQRGARAARAPTHWRTNVICASMRSKTAFLRCSAPRRMVMRRWTASAARNRALKVCDAFQTVVVRPRTRVTAVDASKAGTRSSTAQRAILLTKPTKRLEQMLRQEVRP